MFGDYLVLFDKYFAVGFTLVALVSGHAFITEKRHSDGSLLSSYCATTSSFALSWLPNNIEKITKKDISEIHPYQPDAQFKCTFTKTEGCRTTWVKEPWKIMDSLTGPIHDPIFDYRWEDLSTLFTQKTDRDKERLQYLQTSIRVNTNLELPFSVRTEQAHIFLCDGAQPQQSSCYWFILQGWNGNITGIRKCTNDGENAVPYIQGVYPKGDCSTLLSETQHIVQDNPSGNSHYKPLYISSQFWTHLNLKIQNYGQSNYLAVSLANTSSAIIEYTDRSKIIDVRSIIIHSKVSNGLWKFHNYEYIYTDESIDKQQLGSLIRASGLVCIALFVKMCPHCILKLELSNRDKNHIFNEVEYRNKNEWTEIKFMTENVKNTEVLLLVSTRSEYEENQFWAIGGTRSCQKRELRTLQSEQRLKCQELTSSGLSSIISTDNESALKGSNCSFDEIGSMSCTPCSYLYEDCNFIKVCERNENGVLECSCSAGFSGDLCNVVCRDSYGHTCEHHCGKCPWRGFWGCSPVNGECPRCEDGYTGKRCNIAQGPRFKEAPHILNVSYTTCTVQMKSVETNTYYNFADSPLYYSFQYKEGNKAEEWISSNVNNYYMEEVPKPALINNLQPGTKYFLRAVISSKVTSFFSDNIPYSVCETKCKEIEKNDIIVNPTNTSVNVNYKLTEESCKLENYDIQVNNTHHPDFSTHNSSYFGNLKPFSNYVIYILRGKGDPIFMYFKTKEGVPGKVANLITAAISSSEIDLQWRKPDQPNGVIRYYKITYKLSSPIACTRSHTSSYTSFMEVAQTKEAISTTVKIQNLIPYSRYLFTIAAVTDSFQGEEEQIYANTSMVQGRIDKNELPTAVREMDEHFIQVNFFEDNCSNRLGPFSLKINLMCLNTWCQPALQAKTIEDFSAADTPKYAFENVHPFSDYQLWIRVCRTENICMEIVNQHFKSKASVPGPVRDLSVYSKDYDSLYIRWDKPYPPTGIIREYEARIINEISRSSKSQVSTNTSCEIWPQLQCIEFHNLEKKMLYTIQVSARNEKPEGNGETRVIETTTEIDRPEDPYDITCDWTVQNDLLLSWKHPNITNGPLEKFFIKIAPESGTNILIDYPLNAYRLIYKHEVDGSQIMPSRSYRITVVSYNEELRSPGLTFVMDYSRPPIPKLEEFPEFIPSNDSIRVSITILHEPTKTRQLVERASAFLLVSENSAEFTSMYTNKIEEITKKKFHKYKMLYECNARSVSKLSIILGNVTSTVNSACQSFDRNELLNPGTNYTIKVVLINFFKNKTAHRIYSEVLQTTGDGPSSQLGGGWIALIFFLLLIALLIVAFIQRRKISSFKNEFFGSARGEDLCEGKGEEIPLPQAAEKISLGPGIKLSSSSPPVSNSKIKSEKQVYSKRVKITDFEDYVKESIANGELARQHSLFPRGTTKSCNYGCLEVNKSKNRYKNLIAYDHTRVILEKINGKEHSDYINANYIDGYKMPRAYIATQGPKASTLNDFWRMIWQERVEHIIMLANILEGGKKKVEKYWPDINSTLQFDKISVQYLTHEVFANYEYRLFNVSRNEEIRKVHQLHFSSWPDHGVPLYCQSLVPFLQRMLKLPLNPRSPVVIHCSAGVGRTGTVILCDTSLRMAAREGSIDALFNLHRLREQRANMVDNIEQYKLAHLVVLECLVGMNTTIPCKEIENSVQKFLSNEEIKIQIRYLTDTAWQDHAMKTVGDVSETPTVVAEKNRFQELIPENQVRLFISRYPITDENSSYINAVRVDGFRSPERYIATQQPMPATVGDFWRLLDEYDVSVVVSLNEIDPDDETSCKFWPTAENPLMKPVDYIILDHVNTNSQGHFDKTTIKLKSKNEESRAVEIISLNNWTKMEVVPKNVEHFLSFWEEAEALTRKSSSTIIVTCYDGVQASGLYLALTFVIEKMKLEQNCDICQAVRSIRHSRSQFVQHEEQFIFLYQAAVSFIKNFQPYANFK